MVLEVEGDGRDSEAVEGRGEERFMLREEGQKGRTSGGEIEEDLSDRLGAKVKKNQCGGEG